MNDLGVVLIGRNEGERLRRSLQSVLRPGGRVCYVDSGSTDDSVALARNLGAEVVELDLSVPFTAARARNEGFARLMELDPELAFVQFLDGDCQVVADWMDHALAHLRSHPAWGVVCGRRREQHPRSSIYNRLTDMEWDTPVGRARSCGGDAMFRVRAFLEAGRFNPAMIAGEEPELCVRLRRAGWEVHRLDAEMTLHDADIHRFRQWWRRAVRAGHAYAEGAAMHGAPPERHNVRSLRSILFWALVVPLLIFGTALLGCLGPGWGLWLSLLLLLGYPLLAVRVFAGRRKRGDAPGPAALYAVFTLISKFAALCGVFQYWRNRLLRRQSRIIEYKQPEVRTS